jgi:hypothetical protein
MQGYLSILGHPQELMILRGVYFLAVLLQHSDARASLVQVWHCSRLLLKRMMYSCV